MPVGVNKYIFWFHVTIRNALNGVQELQHQNYLGSIETSSVYLELFGSA